MDLGQEQIANSVADQVDEMQRHPVVTGEPAGAKANDHAIVCHTDHQRSALDIGKACRSLQHSQVHLLVHTAAVQIGTQGRLVLDGVGLPPPAASRIPRPVPRWLWRQICW